MHALLPRLGLATCLLLVSCGTYSTDSPHALATAQRDLQGTTLPQAETLLRKAFLFSRQRTPAAVYRLRAAEIAWDTLLHTPPSHAASALHVLAQAQEGLAPLFVDRQPPTQTFSYAGSTYVINVPAGQPGTYDPQTFLSLKSTEHSVNHLCHHCMKQDGAGARFSAQWKVPEESKLRPFLSSRGFGQPITTTLDFSNQAPHHATLVFRDATALCCQQVKIGNATHPLSANFTAPMEDVISNIRELYLGVQGTLAPSLQEDRLTLLEPYDPQRIPVVLVHGLFSHPRMWRDVVNELRADPALRGRFQFWIFSYPTGWPILYSGLRLREQLTALYATLPIKPPPLILIGHSMGGLLSQLQAVNPGRTLWDANFGKNSDRMFAALPASNINKRSMIFTANPHLSRIVFICVPHRGSKIAKWSLVRMLASTIRLPRYLLNATLDLPHLGTRTTKINGLTRLAPDNPTFPALDGLKLTVPFHSIIGDRGKGDTPNSSDGAVQYWSSHLDGAQSERIVPANHGAYDHPDTIAELKRILLLQLSR